MRGRRREKRQERKESNESTEKNSAEGGRKMEEEKKEGDESRGRKGGRGKEEGIAGDRKEMEWVRDLARGIAKVGEELERIRRILECGKRGNAGEGGERAEQESEEKQQSEEEEGRRESQAREEEGSEEYWEERVKEVEVRQGEGMRKEGGLVDKNERRDRLSGEGKADMGEGVRERMRRWIEEQAQKRVEEKYGMMPGREEKMKVEEEMEEAAGGSEKEREEEGWVTMRSREVEVRRRREEKEKEIEEKDRKVRKGEVERREARKKNLIWRGIEGRNARERRGFMEGVMRRMLGRRIGVKEVQERVGEGGRIVLLVELVEEEDRDEILKRNGEIRRIWEIGVDEDLTMEERKVRWRIVKKAKEEKLKGREVYFTNRKLWIDDREWRWNEGRGVGRYWNEEDARRRGGGIDKGKIWEGKD